MGSATQETSLGQMVAAIIDMRAELRANGADEHAVSVATERSIRLAWPSVREWKYLCHTCDDYGLEMGFCPGDRTCGRDKQHLPHEFGRPCWCSAGAKFRKREVNPDVDHLEAGKTPKPKRFTRFGQ
jgi:hypothetical protein